MTQVNSLLNGAALSSPLALANTFAAAANQTPNQVNQALVQEFHQLTGHFIKSGYPALAAQLFGRLGFYTDHGAEPGTFRYVEDFLKALPDSALTTVRISLGVPALEGPAETLLRGVANVANASSSVADTERIAEETFDSFLFQLFRLHDRPFKQLVRIILQSESKPVLMQAVNQSVAEAESAQFGYGVRHLERLSEAGFKEAREALQNLDASNMIAWFKENGFSEDTFPSLITLQTYRNATFEQALKDPNFCQLWNEASDEFEQMVAEDWGATVAVLRDAGLYDDKGTPSKSN